MRTRAKKNHSSPKKAMGSFRIIGGEWRSRRLSFPGIEGLRPTTDRVKETVFNWLSGEIEGAKVLDLFAGSCSLGFEALSRGAESLTAIEKDRSAAQAIRDNLNLLKGEAEVIQNDAIAWLKQNANEQTGSPFSLIFLDPPFRQGLLDSCLELLENSAILEPNALIYLELEQERRDLLVPSGWQLLKEKSAGQVSYRLYQT